MAKIKDLSMRLEAEKAIMEWLENHEPSEGFKIVSGGYRLKRQGRKRTAPFVVFYKEGDERPWSVQCNGNGHYFETAENMHYDLLIAEDWVNMDQLDLIISDENRIVRGVTAAS